MLGAVRRRSKHGFYPSASRTEFHAAVLRPPTPEIRQVCDSHAEATDPDLEFRTFQNGYCPVGRSRLKSPLELLKGPRVTSSMSRKQADPMNDPIPGIEDLDDIPGTTIFTLQRARRGYPLNQFCMSLMSPSNRTEFKSDERAYLARWPMSSSARDAVLRRDFNAMIAEGGNIY
jgi:Aromatic-ring-opening dioxygenase LigAB, LigA subunit